MTTFGKSFKSTFSKKKFVVQSSNESNQQQNKKFEIKSVLTNQSNIVKCHFCSKSATTHCVDCGKPLCDDHKYTYWEGWSKDRCHNHHILCGGKAVGNGVINTINVTNGLMNWLSRLYGR